MTTKRRGRHGWFWFVVRAGLIILGLIPMEQPAVRPSMSEGQSWLPNLVAFLLCFVVGTTGVFGVMAVVRVRKGRDIKWQRPSWFTNPFFGEAIQFFHAAALFVMAAGSSDLVMSMRAGASLAFATATLGLGLGVWIGVYAYATVFTRDFAEVSGSIGGTVR